MIGRGLRGPGAGVLPFSGAVGQQRGQVFQTRNGDHALGGDQAAAIQLPVLILFQQHRSHQTHDRGVVGEDTHNLGAALDGALCKAHLSATLSRSSRLVLQICLFCGPWAGGGRRGLLRRSGASTSSLASCMSAEDLRATGICNAISPTWVLRVRLRQPSRSSLRVAPLDYVVVPVGTKEGSKLMLDELLKPKAEHLGDQLPVLLPTYSANRSTAARLGLVMVRLVEVVLEPGRLGHPEFPHIQRHSPQFCGVPHPLRGRPWGPPPEMSAPPRRRRSVALGNYTSRRDAC